MAWTDPVDIYCERLAPGLLDEPLNAFSNLAFIIAAVIVWPRVRGDVGAQLLCAALFLIGIGSGLFHTFATQITSLADVLAILIYILIYVFLATSRVMHARTLWCVAAVILFFPYAALTGYLLNMALGSLNGSVSYLPVLLLITAYGLWAEDPVARRGLLIGAGILAVSLFFRSIDHAVCEAVPQGVHFMWHILNAIMLGWMILVINRVGLAPDAREG